MPKNTTDFSSLGIPADLLQKIAKLGYAHPTPIQEQAIPAGLEGRDVVGIAQTGTGKTLAFGIPMLANLEPGQIGLVLVPTRELAVQVEESLAKLGARVVTLIGGVPMGPQISRLKSRPTIIVATPGRLIDHLQRRTVHLGRVAIFVLDEADRMLDLGFAPAIRQIAESVPAERQTMLFSATMPRTIEGLASSYLTDPVRLEATPPGTVADRVEQELLVIDTAAKPAALREILHAHRGTVLVFTRTRHGARRLAHTLRTQGHATAELHSDRTVSQRKAALNGFKSGEFRVLVATDIAARGLDVKEIALVVNYDLPGNPEDYVHRIGRTGRAGASGRAITFASPDQHRGVKEIETHLKLTLPIGRQSEGSFPVKSAAAAPPKRRRFGRKPFAR